MKIIKSLLLSSFDNLVHGFVNSSFNSNIEQLTERFGLCVIKTLKQIHSKDVFFLESEDQIHEQTQGDAIITTLDSVGVGVYSADCVPILFYDRKSGSVGAIHAGRRGTYLEVASSTIINLINKLETRPENISAVIGPCIERCCYKVGIDVAKKFIDKFEDTDDYLFSIDSKKYILDLKQANLNQMKKLGLSEIETLDICTKCNADLPSYRRDGKSAGRILSFIASV